MLWFLGGLFIAILGGYIVVELLKLVFSIIGWFLQLILSIFGLES